MDLRLRESKPSDMQFMREMLYEAVFWRPNPKKPALEEGLADPGARNALVDWGQRDGDAAVVMDANIETMHKLLTDGGLTAHLQ